jgi:ribonuclease Z
MTDTKTTVTFLGTSSVIPGAGHDTSSFLINGRCLVDTGWYAVLKMKSYGFDPLDLEWLFLTHLHHDHYMGLPQILFYLSMRRSDRPDRLPLKIAGPAEDLARVVSLAQRFLQPERFESLAYEPRLYPLKPGLALEDPAFRLDTCSSLHPVPGLCYRFTDQKTGAAFVFTGDTAYHPPIAALAKGAALLIHEASYGPDPGPAGDAWGHSGAPDAARIAREAGVKRLALVHCAEDRQEAALAAARALFPNSFWPKDGEAVTVE